MPDSSKTGPRNFSSGLHDAGRRLHRGQVVQRKGHGLAGVRDAVGQRAGLLDADALLRAQHDVVALRLGVPVGRPLVVGEVDLALIAVGGGEPDVAGIDRAVLGEAEVEVVLGRIDLDAIRQLLQHRAEHRERIVDGRRRRRADTSPISASLVCRWMRSCASAGRRSKDQRRRDQAGQPSPCSLLGKLQPHLPIALRIVAPALAHLDEQEQVHLLLQDVGRARGAPPRRSP